MTGFSCLKFRSFSPEKAVTNNKFIRKSFEDNLSRRNQSGVVLLFYYIIKLIVKKRDFDKIVSGYRNDHLTDFDRLKPTDLLPRKLL